MDRFYRPIWVIEAEQMQAALDETRANVMYERRKEFAVDRMFVVARNYVVEKSAPVDVFELEWDDRLP
jgi:hypothetical protein